MNEIQVVVNQEPGKVTWNFDDIKSALETWLADFQGVVYTDQTIKNAKQDVATLRKLSKSIDDQRKEIRKKCLAPYEIIESQARQLNDLIEKPIQAINEQVQDYESRRREQVRKQINDYWDIRSEILPEDMREAAYNAKYDSRWENATTSKKTWKTEIDQITENIMAEIATIKTFCSEFEDDMLAEYKKTFSLQAAISTMNQLNMQKERILEAERKKAEEEQRIQKVEQSAMPPKQPAPEPQPQQSDTFDYDAVPGSFTQAAKNAGFNLADIFDEDGGKTVCIAIHGTDQQIDKIRQYIQFAGAQYKEV